MKRQALLHIPRTVVRAAMTAERFEMVGSFGRVSDEEYGNYVFWNDADEIIMLCWLNEDDGGIEIGTMEDFCADQHPDLPQITEAINPPACR